MREKLLKTQDELKKSESQRLYYVGIIKENEQIINRLEEENNKLKAPFDDQESRINFITIIAQKERKNLYNDIIDLMNDQERFQLDNILGYSISQWLALRNPVIVKFIESLTYNENENQHGEEKLFKCAVAINAIYGARHLKYVSSINLAASAIKYSIAKSKKIIDIDNHILSSGSFFKFLKWQENLACELEPIPKGLVFMAFDNEQKGLKNYLDRGNNTVIFHTVTSFVGFNFDPTETMQFDKDPWLHKKLNPLQIEQLFDITPNMKILLDKQLHEFLSNILDEAIVEKNKEKNHIDELTSMHISKVSKQKRCNECGKNEIEKSRRKCPECNAKLPSLSETQQIIQETNNTTFVDNTNKSLIFKINQFENRTSEKDIKMLSITQKSFSQEGVTNPNMFIPDPIPINPNSITNVRKVLDHIQEISGIKRGDRKWVVVVCDGVPYHYAQKMKDDYPGILLLPGPLHEEMNMLKAFVELNWYYNVSFYYIYIIYYILYIILICFRT